MKSKNEIPAIFFFLQLYKEVIVYIFLDSNAASLKVFLKFVIPCKFSSAIFTQPSAMSLYHRQTKEINCASHKSNLIYNKNGASSNCLPELVRLSLISGSSLNQSTEEPWVAGGFTLRYDSLSCWDLVFQESVGSLREENLQVQDTDCQHRQNEMSVSAGAGPRRSTAHRHCIQGCGAGVSGVALTSYCPISTTCMFICDSSAEGIKSSGRHGTYGWAPYLHHSW